jgi:hypothetical protein
VAGMRLRQDGNQSCVTNAIWTAPRRGEASGDLRPPLQTVLAHASATMILCT